MIPPTQTQPGQPVESAGLEASLAGSGFRLREIQPLAGDVSPRRYARVVAEDGTTAILATYPEEVRETCPRFLRTTALLEAAGVRVPRILGSDCAHGWMLVEDLGPNTLGEWKGRPWDEILPWFERALDLADRIARIPTESLAGLNPVLGAELLRRELKQTWDLFLEPRGLTGGPELAAALGSALDAICETLAAETPVSCHRDYMARNLMPLSSGELAVLDHQDLRLGPPLYDLASLLNDTLFPPPEIEAALLARVLTGEGDRVRYHRAAAQRALKAVGTYTSFALRGADRHLPLVAPTLGHCLRHMALVPESAPIADELRRAWSPVLEGTGH